MIWRSVDNTITGLGFVHSPKIESDVFSPLVADVMSGEAGSHARPYAADNGYVYFTAAAPEPTIWRTDGTAVGTQLVVIVDVVEDLEPVLNAPEDVIVHSEKSIFFSTPTSIDTKQREYWVADITVGSVTRLGSTQATTARRASSFHVLGQKDGGTLFLMGQKLWRRQDGQNTLLKDFSREPIALLNDDPIVMESLFAKDGEFYFGRYESSSFQLPPEKTRQVWMTDGTVEGTRQIDGFPIWPDQPHFVGDQIYFIERFTTFLPSFPNENHPPGIMDFINGPSISRRP